MKFFRVKFILSLLLLCLINGLYAKNQGLQNLGNSCYFNGTWQALSHLDAFEDFLLRNAASYELYDVISGQRLGTSLYISITRALKSGDPVSDLSSFYAFVRLRVFKNLSKDQQDARELVEYFIRNSIILDHVHVRNLLSSLGTVFVATFNQYMLTQNRVETQERRSICLRLLKTLIEELSRWLSDSLTISDTLGIEGISKQCKRGTDIYKAFETQNLLPLLTLFLRKIQAPARMGIPGTRDELISHIRPLNELRAEIFNLLYCKIRETKTCAEGGHTGKKDEASLGIKVHLPDVKPGVIVKLLACVKNIFLPNQLSRDDWWACEKCGAGSVRSFTKTSVLHWPQFLIIQLVRFSFQPNEFGEYVSKKINIPVSFPLAMGLGDNYYELRSFIVQAGELDGGHYWALGRDADGKWYRYDDSIVREIEDVQREITESGIDDNGGWGGTPYILFYEKKAISVDTLAPDDRLNLAAIPDIPPKLEQLRASLGDLSKSLIKVQDKLKKLKKI